MCTVKCDYLNQVYNRFLNPYVDHQLASIRLNHYSKFITRVWPSIDNYIENYQTVPKRLSFAFAALILFYQGGNDHLEYEIQDDSDLVEKFQSFYAIFDGSKQELISFIQTFIKEDFLSHSEETKIESLSHLVAEYFFLIKEKGMEFALAEIKKGEL